MKKFPSPGWVKASTAWQAQFRPEQQFRIDGIYTFPAKDGKKAYVLIEFSAIGEPEASRVRIPGTLRPRLTDHPVIPKTVPGIPFVA